MRENLVNKLQKYTCVFKMYFKRSKHLDKHSTVNEEREKVGLPPLPEPDDDVKMEGRSFLSDMISKVQSITEDAASTIISTGN